MRKLEEEMVAAVTNVENWANGNTMVAWCAVPQGEMYSYRPSEINGVTSASIALQNTIDKMYMGYVFLHGHRIATVYRDGTVVPDLLTLSEWPTTTTKSRLRALGVNVYTKNFTTYVDNAAIHQG